MNSANSIQMDHAATRMQIKSSTDFGVELIVTRVEVDGIKVAL